MLSARLERKKLISTIKSANEPNETTRYDSTEATITIIIIILMDKQ